MSKNLHGVENTERGKNISQTTKDDQRIEELIFGILTSADTPLFARALSVILFAVGALIMSTGLMLGAIIFFLIMLPFGWVSKRKQKPLRNVPKHIANLVSKDPMTKKKPAGEIYIGVERKTGRQLWLSHEEDNMHSSVFGGTGSGKTEFFVSTVWHYLTIGSGVFSIDPKGDVKYPHQVGKMARMLGRDHDLTMVSYLTKLEEDEDGYSVPSQTNRLNLISGDWVTEREILFDLMPESEGQNSNFIENAKVLIETHLRALSMLRDQGVTVPNISMLGKLINNPNYLFAYLGLGEPLREDPIEPIYYHRLGQNQNFAESVERIIRAFSGNPELTYSENIKNAEFERQAGFVISNTMKVINVFSVQFESIFNNTASDVTYIELLKERRLHVELLPSLTKAKDTTQLLGKLATAGMKQALAANIPATMEGASYSVLNSLPSASRQLYPLIFDEYGAIRSEHSELIFTQGRSFNVAARIGTQDKQGGEGASEAERKVFGQILNNTFLTVGMRVDDPDHTGKFLVSKGHKIHLNITEGYDTELGGRSLGTVSKGSSSYKEIDVVSSRDLAQQSVGEAHAFYAGEVARVKTPYVDLDLDNNAQLNINRLVLFRLPSLEDLARHSGIYADFEKYSANLCDNTIRYDFRSIPEVTTFMEYQEQFQDKMQGYEIEELYTGNLMQFILLHYNALKQSEMNLDKTQAAYLNKQVQLQQNTIDAFNFYAPIPGSDTSDQGEYEEVQDNQEVIEGEFANTVLAIGALIDEEEERNEGNKAKRTLYEMDLTSIHEQDSHVQSLQEKGSQALFVALSEDDRMRNEVICNMTEQSSLEPKTKFNSVQDFLRKRYTDFDFGVVLNHTGDNLETFNKATQQSTELSEPATKILRRGRPPTVEPGVFKRSTKNTATTKPISESVHESQPEELSTTQETQPLQDNISIDYTGQRQPIAPTLVDEDDED